MTSKTQNTDRMNETNPNSIWFKLNSIWYDYREKVMQSLIFVMAIVFLTFFIMEFILWNQHKTPIRRIRRGLWMEVENERI